MDFHLNAGLLIFGVIVVGCVLIWGLGRLQKLYPSQTAQAQSLASKAGTDVSTIAQSVNSAMQKLVNTVETHTATVTASHQATAVAIQKMVAANPTIAAKSASATATGLTLMPSLPLPQPGNPDRMTTQNYTDQPTIIEKARYYLDNSAVLDRYQGSLPDFPSVLNLIATKTINVGDSTYIPSINTYVTKDGQKIGPLVKA